MKITAIDLKALRRTLALARRGGMHTLPNPQVGAVIIANGTIIGEGYHKRAGEPHAEINAIQNCKNKNLLKGATLYINLEPCCHTDKRTPPCTIAIQKVGIQRVVTIMQDPNPKVSGKGIAKCKGICLESIHQNTKEIRQLVTDAHILNKVFVTNMRQKRPFITLKLGMSLDGKIATAHGESQWITNSKARHYGHRLRTENQAIMVGINTVLRDNPALTTHGMSKHEPLRIVLDRLLRIPLTANVLKTPHALIVTTAKASQKKKKILQKKGVKILTLPEKTTMHGIFDALFHEGIMSILVEGGATVAGGIIREHVVDELYFFYAPLIIGGEKTAAIGGNGVEKLSTAPHFTIKKIQKIGDNFLVRATPTGQDHS